MFCFWLRLNSIIVNSSHGYLRSKLCFEVLLLPCFFSSVIVERGDWKRWPRSRMREIAKNRFLIRVGVLDLWDNILEFEGEENDICFLWVGARVSFEPCLLVLLVRSVEIHLEPLTRTRNHFGLCTLLIESNPIFLYSFI